MGCQHKLDARIATTVLVTNKHEQISMVGYTHAAEGGLLPSFSMRHCLASTAGLMPGADQNAEMLIAQLAQVA
jgi:hypothetical protein